MKRIGAGLWALFLCLALAGCGEEVHLQLPFVADEVVEVEAFQYDDPETAKVKVCEAKEQIVDVCEMLERIPLTEKASRADGTVTAFRFHLNDDQVYEVVYVAEAVKSGRLSITGEDEDYFTSADLGGYWANLEGEAVPVTETSLPMFAE